jgi:hypothetical protein
VCDVSGIPTAFRVDPFDWMSSTCKPVRHLDLPSPELTAGCCDLPLEAWPYVGDEIRRSPIIPDASRAAELELPLLDIAVAATDIRESERPAQHAPPQPANVAQNPPMTSFPYPAPNYPPPFYPAYPPVMYPIAYQMAVPPTPELPPTDALISALMSASAARPAQPAGVQTKGATVVDAATIASILPALLASGWVRIEPEMAHPVRLEPAPLRESEPDMAASTSEPLVQAATPGMPRLHHFTNPALDVACLHELEAFPAHVEITPFKVTMPVDSTPAVSLRSQEVTLSSGLGRSTASYPLEPELREASAAFCPVDADCIAVPLQPVRPRIAHPQRLNPAWKRRRLEVQPSIHPLDMSLFDIPAEAGEWARE